MSVRNIDADLAASKLNELFHLHRYDDCVLFVNRLSPLALLHLLPNLPIDAYLARLPYTIELFESLYAKVFIHDPEHFPDRTLQPEKLIDKMVAYFSLLHMNSSSLLDNYDSDLVGGAFLEPIDGAKMLDSFENVIRVISYVQPQQYSRLLYFKYAIDRALLRFERDLVSLSRNLSSLNEYLLANHSYHHHHHYQSSSALKKSSRSLASAGGGAGAGQHTYANALLISRASNLQTCETMRIELEKSIGNCQKAHLKLNEYISHLKSQKLSKNLQSIVFGVPSSGGRDLSPSSSPTEIHSAATTAPSSRASTLQQTKKSKNRERKSSASTEREPPATLKKNSGTLGRKQSQTPRSESVSNFRLSGAALGNHQPPDVTSETTMKKSYSQAQLGVGAGTICQDFIQNRLYLNKAMMNSIEPFLESIRLQQMLNSLYEKIDLDKEILLVYTHIKREESYLSSLEPLQPLFKRYSLGFERCIQIWRKKCSADSLLLCNSLDPVLVLPNNSTDQSQQVIVPDSKSNRATTRPTSELLTSSPNLQADHSIYSLSNQLNISSTTPARGPLETRKHNHHQLAAAAALTAAATSSLAAAIQSTDSNELVKNQHNPTTQTAVVNSNISINYSSTTQACESLSRSGSIKQKCFSEVNLYSNQQQQQPSMTTQIPPKLGLPNLENDSTNDSKRSSRSPIAGLTTSSVETQTCSLETVIEAEVAARKVNDKLVSDARLDQAELEKLRDELNKAKETIAKLKDENEKSKREKSAEKIVEHKAATTPIQEEVKKSSTSGSQETVVATTHHTTTAVNYQFTYDIIHLYNNLNHKYRVEAFAALDLSASADTQNVFEFKVKLLFSVIVLAYRYVKTYIRDLKRRVKSLLQINERSSSVDRHHQQQQQHANQHPQTGSASTPPPKIVIQRPEDVVVVSDPSTHPNSSHKRPSLGHCSRYHHQTLRTTVSADSEQQQASSIRSIESALDAYFQTCALTNSFDLNKIIEEVKQQLWTTLSEYPQLRDCHELNVFIGESVKTSWSLVNHQPTLKLDYSTTRFDPHVHERSDTSNVANEQVVNYVWPALIESSDSSCLSKGIVIT